MNRLSPMDVLMPWGSRCVSQSEPLDIGVELGVQFDVQLGPEPQAHRIGLPIWHQRQERRCRRCLLGAKPAVAVGQARPWPVRGATEDIEAKGQRVRASELRLPRKEPKRPPGGTSEGMVHRREGSSGKVELFGGDRSPPKSSTFPEDPSRPTTVRAPCKRWRKRRITARINVEKHSQHLRAGRKVADLCQAWCGWGWAGRPPGVPVEDDRPWCQQTPTSCHTCWVPQGGFWPSGQTQIFHLRHDPPQGKLVLDNPISCFHEKVPCPDKADFVRKKLNEVDRHRFRLHILDWGEPHSEAWVEDIVEDSRR